MEIRTKDADEAAFYWLQQGFQLTKLQVTDGFKKRLWFCFTTKLNEEQFEFLRMNYRNGKTLVEPKAFANKRLEIKNLIRQNVFS